MMQGENLPNKVLTRAEYDRGPKPPEGKTWLKDMQDMVNGLKAFYTVFDTDHLSDQEMEVVAEEQMAVLTQKATQVLETTPFSDNLTFLSYTYWACMEEAEKMDELCYAVVRNEEERTLRAEAMLRKQVLFGWLQALNSRIESLGGKIPVEQ